MQKRLLFPAVAMTAMLAMSPVASVLARPSSDDDQSSRVKHVLLISIDGLHAADLKRFVAEHPQSTLAMLSERGTTYTSASASRPSDSFPGLLAMITGGTPKTTGVYYDDSYDRNLLPPLTFKAGDTPGTEVVYDESVDKDLNAIDGGGSINPDALPRDPVTKKPVYPHSFLRVNTIFEVAKAAGKYTAWSDKHLSYEIVNGPSGNGVDDLYTPEIAAGGTTGSMTLTLTYDGLKVAAILNEINGKDHTGQKNTQVPAIFGMNFQAVSVVQKLPGNGYLDGNGTFSPGLADALSFVDASLGKMVSEIKKQKLDPSTMVIITAKHGQSPIDPAQLKFIAKATLTNGVDSNIAQLTADDIGLIWLKDASKTSATLAGLEANKQSASIKDIYSFGASNPKWLYDDPAKDSRTPDIVLSLEPWIEHSFRALQKIETAAQLGYDKPN